MFGRASLQDLGFVNRSMALSDCGMHKDVTILGDRRVACGTVSVMEKLEELKVSTWLRCATHQKIVNHYVSSFFLESGVKR